MPSREQSYQRAGLEQALKAFAQTGELRLVVSSGSMRPLLQVGDAVIAAPVQPESISQLGIAPGDLLLIAGADGSLTTHRLLALTGRLTPYDTIWTKGDAAWAADP